MEVAERHGRSAQSCAAGSHPEEKNEEKNHEIHLFGIHQTRNIRRDDQARDMNHAVQLMAQHPALKYGGIFEIRPAADLNELMKASEQRRQQNTAR
jgi:hypothetical protein